MESEESKVSDKKLCKSKDSKRNEDGSDKILERGRSGNAKNKSAKRSKKRLLDSLKMFGGGSSDEKEGKTDKSKGGKTDKSKEGKTDSPKKKIRKNLENQENQLRKRNIPDKNLPQNSAQEESVNSSTNKLENSFNEDTDREGSFSNWNCLTAKLCWMGW